MPFPLLWDLLCGINAANSGASAVHVTYMENWGIVMQFHSLTWSG